MLRRELMRRTQWIEWIIFGSWVIGCNEDALRQKPIAQTASSASVSEEKPLPPMPKASPLAQTPVGLSELKTPGDNPLTAESAALGKQLFFDKRLSKDGSASCESCHFSDKGWTDAKAFSPKVGGAMNTRHTPTLWNVGYNERWYWDGRAETLEKQVEAAWKGQMGADPIAIAKILNQIPEYLVQFKTIYQSQVTPETIAKALASFVRTLRSGNSPWDQYEKGNKEAVSAAVVRGWEIFRGKGGCAACHAPPLFTDNSFHNVGIGYDKSEPDIGRGKITKEEKDNGAFKTPTLRSITTSAPYFHDGRSATLEEAVDLMVSGGIKNPNLDKRLKPIQLAVKEKADLIEFLKSLESPAVAFEKPNVP